MNQTKSIKKAINNLWTIQKNLKSNSAISFIIKSINNLEDCLKEEIAFYNLNHCNKCLKEINDLNNLERTELKKEGSFICSTCINKEMDKGDKF